MGKLAKRATPTRRTRKAAGARGGGNGVASGKARHAGRPKSLREMNRWITEHHDELVAAAKENCRRLIGKPTL